MSAQDSTPQKRPHVAAIDFAEFYAAALPDSTGIREFVRKVDALGPEHNEAKIVLHQAARMVWLGDRLDEVAHGRPALQVLFYLIAAEATAKIVFGFAGEGKSRHYVWRFFADICSDKHRARLGQAFSSVVFLSWERAVDVLYRVRCNVAHVGMYYSFNLPLEGDSVPIVTHVGPGNCVSHITLSGLRRITLEGAVLGCQKVLVAAGITL
jgi:hypothetical protein